MQMKKLLNILVALLLSWTAYGQESFVVLKGKVIDSADGYPLIGVSVSVPFFIIPSDSGAGSVSFFIFFA